MARHTGNNGGRRRAARQARELERLAAQLAELKDAAARQGLIERPRGVRSLAQSLPYQSTRGGAIQTLPSPASQAAARNAVERQYPDMPKIAKKSALLHQYGAPGTAIMQGIITDDDYNPDFHWRDAVDLYEQMTRSDGQIMAIIQQMELPIRRATWAVEPFSDKPRDKEIASFVESCLLEELRYTTETGRTLHQKWDDVLRHALMMLRYGFSAFEKIWRQEDGWIKLARLLPLLPISVYRWWVGPDNELVGIQQYTYKDYSYCYVDIPAEKLLTFHHRMEGQNYTGFSLLRAAYKHWYFKDQLYKIDAIGLERNAIAVPYIKLPEAYTDDEVNDALAMMANMRANESMGVTLPPGWEIGYVGGGDRYEAHAMESIQHHDMMIARAVLAQFINLGSNETGSYSLAQEQVDTFLTALQGEAEYIEDVFNSDLIPQLVDFNYDKVEGYPKLKCSKLVTADISELTDAISKLKAKDASFLTPDAQLEDWIRDQFGMPKAPKNVINGANPMAAANSAQPDTAHGADGQATGAATGANASSKPIQTPSGLLPGLPDTQQSATKATAPGGRPSSDKNAQQQPQQVSASALAKAHGVLPEPPTPANPHGLPLTHIAQLEAQLEAAKSDAARAQMESAMHQKAAQAALQGQQGQQGGAGGKTGQDSGSGKQGSASASSDAQATSNARRRRRMMEQALADVARFADAGLEIEDAVAAALGSPEAQARAKLLYAPGQPRDYHGRFGPVGGGGIHAPGGLHAQHGVATHGQGLGAGAATSAHQAATLAAHYANARQRMLDAHSALGKARDALAEASDRHAAHASGRHALEERLGEENAELTRVRTMVSKSLSRPTIDARLEQHPNARVRDAFLKVRDDAAMYQRDAAETRENYLNQRAAYTEMVSRHGATSPEARAAQREMAAAHRDDAEMQSYAAREAQHLQEIRDRHARPEDYVDAATVDAHQDVVRQIAHRDAAQAALNMHDAEAARIQREEIDPAQAAVTRAESEAAATRQAFLTAHSQHFSAQIDATQAQQRDAEDRMQAAQDRLNRLDGEHDAAVDEQHDARVALDDARQATRQGLEADLMARYQAAHPEYVARLAEAKAAAEAAHEREVQATDAINTASAAWRQAQSEHGYDSPEATVAMRAYQDATAAHAVVYRARQEAENRATALGNDPFFRESYDALSARRDEVNARVGELQQRAQAEADRFGELQQRLAPVIAEMRARGATEEEIRQHPLYQEREQARDARGQLDNAAWLASVQARELNDHVNERSSIWARRELPDDAAVDAHPTVAPHAARMAAVSARVQEARDALDQAYDAQNDVLNERQQAIQRLAQLTRDATYAQGSAEREADRLAAGVHGIPDGQSQQHQIVDQYGNGRAALKAMFGRDLTDDEIGSLVGALPGDTIKVDGALSGDHATLTLHGAGYDGHNHGSAPYFAERELTRDPSTGEIKLDNNYFRQNVTGQGLGTRIFARQVEGAGNLGVSNIHVHAAGSKNDPTFNGYYTWARFGYNAPLNHYQRDMLTNATGRDYSHVQDMHQLMSTEQGRDDWKEHGQDWYGDFDLRAGSDHRNILDKYRAERGIALAEALVGTYFLAEGATPRWFAEPISQADALEGAELREELPTLSDEDEAALDRVWARHMAHRRPTGAPWSTRTTAITRTAGELLRESLSASQGLLLGDVSGEARDYHGRWTASGGGEGHEGHASGEGHGGREGGKGGRDLRGMLGAKQGEAGSRYTTQHVDATWRAVDAHQRLLTAARAVGVARAAEAEAAARHGEGSYHHQLATQERQMAEVERDSAIGEHEDAVNAHLAARGEGHAERLAAARAASDHANNEYLAEMGRQNARRNATREAEAEHAGALESVRRETVARQRAAYFAAHPEEEAAMATTQREFERVNAEFERGRQEYDQANRAFTDLVRAGGHPGEPEYDAASARAAASRRAMDDLMTRRYEAAIAAEHAEFGRANSELMNASFVSDEALSGHPTVAAARARRDAAVAEERAGDQRLRDLGVAFNHASDAQRDIENEAQDHAVEARRAIRDAQNQALDAQRSAERESREARGLPATEDALSEHGVPSAGREGYRIEEENANGRGRETLKDLFGRELTDEEIGGLVGALPGDTIKVTRQGRDTVVLNLEASDERKADGLGYEASRVLERQPDGRLTMYNNFFSQETPGTGQGLRIFARQVQTLGTLGVHEIGVHAAGHKTDPYYNGYYTWARFGYNTHLSTATIRNLSARSGHDFSHVQTMHDLMSTPEGRDAWKEYGIGWHGTFDTSPGSEHRGILDRYRAERGVALADRLAAMLLGDGGRRPRGSAGQNRQEEIGGLSAEDEAALDRAWHHQMAHHRPSGHPGFAAATLSAPDAGLTLYAPGEPRDYHGRWTSGGGGGEEGGHAGFGHGGHMRSGAREAIHEGLTHHAGGRGAPEHTSGRSEEEEGGPKRTSGTKAEQKAAEREAKARAKAEAESPRDAEGNYKARPAVDKIEGATVGVLGEMGSRIPHPGSARAHYTREAQALMDEGVQKRTLNLYHDILGVKNSENSDEEYKALTTEKGVGNLTRLLHDSYLEHPEEFHAAKQWYNTAHEQTAELAKRYGVSHEMATAAVAMTSPQNPWDMMRNVKDASGKDIKDPGTKKPMQELVYANLRDAEMGLKYGLNPHLELSVTAADIAGMSGSYKGYLKGGVRDGSDIVAGKTYRAGDLTPVGIQGMLGARPGFGEQEGEKPIGIPGNVGKVIEMARAWSDPESPVSKMSGPEIAHTYISGPKTRSFYNNIIDPSNGDSVTVDMHAQRGLDDNIHVQSDDTGKVYLSKGTINDGQYAGSYPHLADMFRITAERWNSSERGQAHPLLPHEVQAITWVRWRNTHEARNSVGGATLTPAQKDKWLEWKTGGKSKSATGGTTADAGGEE